MQSTVIKSSQVASRSVNNHGVAIKRSTNHDTFREFFSKANFLCVKKDYSTFNGTLHDFYKYLDIFDGSSPESGT